MLTLIGTSHRTAPVEVRERFAFDHPTAVAAMRHIKTRGWADEIIIASTCNRTEIYAAGDTNIEQIVALLAARAGLEPIEAQQYLCIKHDADCVGHLFRVTAGMDSMIVGEAQIQGQIKAAFEAALHVDGPGRIVGPFLSRLFQAALSVGGRVRTHTELGTGTASVPGAAVSLAAKVLGKLKDKRVLVIGAGHMSALVLKHLADEDPALVTVVSRTRDSAQRLAQRFHARAAVTTELPLLLASHDLVITATSCPTTILSITAVSASRAHLRTPLCIIDIAVPRDTEPAVGKLSNVFLFDIDDLSQIVDENLERRRGQWPLAEKIVAEGVAALAGWLEARTAVPLITRLRAEAEHVRKTELERALKGLEHLTQEERERIDVLTQQLINKVLHKPTVRLRGAAATVERETVLQAASYLFE